MSAAGQETTARRPAIQRLARLGHRLATHLAERDVDAILAQIAEAAAAIACADHVHVWLVDWERERLRLAAGVGGTVAIGVELPLGPAASAAPSYAARVARTGQPLDSGDAPDDPDPALVELHRQLGTRTFLGLPVKVGPEILGVLSFMTEAPRRYDDDDRTFLQMLADQAAVALEHARLYAALERRVARRRVFTRLTRLISSSLRLADVLPEINRAAIELVEAPLSLLWLADEDVRTITLASASDASLAAGLPRSCLGYGEGAVGWAAEQRERLVLADAGADGRCPITRWARERGFTSFVALPVVLDDELLAVLAFLGREPFVLDEDQDDLIDAFVAQTAVAIRNARLYAASEQRRREAEALAEIGRALSQTRDPDVVAGRVVDMIGELLQSRSAVLFACRPPSGDFVALAARGELTAVVRNGDVVSARSILANVRDARAPIVTTDFLDDARFEIRPRSRAALAGLEDRAFVAVPLTAETRLLGILCVGDRFGRLYSVEEVRLAQTFADQAALALESARLYRETQATLAELRARNTELDAFAYSVSHDLKAPLVAIDGMAGALLDECTDRLDENGQHYLYRLQANVRHMERLIADVLALSRVGRTEQARERVDVGEIVDDALSRLMPAARAAGIVISRGDMGMIVGVRADVEQVFGNLVSNAIKYMGDTRAPRVEIGREDRGAMVEYWVRDNGIGIAPDYQAKIFEIFQRLKDVDAEGTGVGLAIVKKIVESAGGRVWVESARGQGSTFRFTWPREGPPPTV